MGMDKKRIVITGASRGIGLEMARILISQGHTVYGAAAVLGIIGSVVIWVISNFVRSV